MMELTKLFGLTHPLIVAPMAGGPTTPALVAASSAAGALGSIAAAYLTPNEIAGVVADVRARTSRAFAINLFVPEVAGPVAPARVAAARAINRPFRDSHGLGEPELAPAPPVDFEAQFAAALELGPAALSFTFGALPAHAAAAARARGIALVGTATSVAEASRLAALGTDLIVLQGREAGGHRGMFDPDAADADRPLIDLIRAVRKTVDRPLVAAGGLMAKGDVARALAAGADAVQLGTAFLATREAGTAGPYRARLLAPGPRVTRLTRAYSGRIARGLSNAYGEALDAHPEAILPFPMQNNFTRDLRRAAERAGSDACSSLWCGAGTGALFTGAAEDLVQRLF